MKLNEIQIDSVFTCLINGLKGSDEENRELYAESIGIISIKLKKKQLDDVFECLNGLKYENECIRALCRSLETISPKLNNKQLNRVFSAFINGLEGKFNWHHQSSEKSLGIIATKANEKQLERIINALISGLKNISEDVRYSCAKSLGVISTNLTDKQLNALPNELENYYFDSYKKKRLKKFQRNGMKNNWRGFSTL
ncbi:hypothetical protein RFI_20055 [Reticulomyxa filosa]|uniref:HEAT repeat domain-containing protein n=1 Tax=Reticulomyxa filosa TaxID=46433 RepID=X6MVZ6_RETFI|nr:hypothetical protein RFI_20055 [Reticulomyxa filosa]|eukprot:ETO17275.1 hypothetical protein RFI_20055 [Reticulomyxa filosa]